MATLSDVNATLKDLGKEQEKTTAAVQTVADRIFAQMEADEKARLRDLNTRPRGGASSEAVAGSAAAGAAGGGLLGGLLSGLGGGLIKSAAGIGALGLALPAFFGGLLAGDAGLKWLGSIGADFNFSALKAAAIGFTDIIMEMDAKAFVVLASIMGISAVGGTNAAKGLGSMGFAISAFLGGLLAGDLVFSGISALGANLDFNSMKEVMSGFSNMITSLSQESMIVLGGLMGLSAITGLIGKDSTGSAKALGAMGFAISAFMGGLLAGDQIFAGVSALGLSLDFGSMKTMFAGFSDAIGALSQDAIVALGGILGISGLAATFGKGTSEALGIASIMTGIGAGIAGLMIGLSAGNKALTWLDSVAGVGGSGLKNAFGLFNDIIGELNNKESIIALTGIIAAGAALGVATTPAGALAAGAGIMAVMTSIGAGIAGLFIGLAAGGKIVDLIESIPGGDGDGFTSIIRMFNDMILAISPEAIDRMADISKKKIGGGLASLAGGIVAMLGAEGLGEIADYFKSAKDALLGAVDWIFGTNLGGEKKKSTIEQIIEGLEPINNLPTDMISKIDQFSAAITGLASSFVGLQEISVEKSTTNLDKMIRDIGSVMAMWPHLTGDNPEPYRPPSGGFLGNQDVDFGGGLKNINDANVAIVTERIKSMREALGVTTVAPSVGATDITSDINRKVSIVKISDEVLTALTTALMQKDYVERTAGSAPSGGVYTDARQTSYSSVSAPSYVLPMGPAVDPLDPGYATRRR